MINKLFLFICCILLTVPSWGSENQLSLSYSPQQTTIKNKGTSVKTSTQDFSLTYSHHWSQPWGKLFLGGIYGKTQEPNISTLERFSLLGGVAYALGDELSIAGTLELGIGHLSYNQPLVSINSFEGQILGVSVGMVYKFSSPWEVFGGVEYLEQIYGSSHGTNDSDIFFSSFSPKIKLSYSF